MTAQVSGLVTFDNQGLLERVDSDLPEAMYLRDLFDELLIRIWQAVIREDLESVLSHEWLTLQELQPDSRNFYRNGGQLAPIRMWE